jgi:hypothetical protein
MTMMLVMMIMTVMISHVGKGMYNQGPSFRWQVTWGTV